MMQKREQRDLPPFPVCLILSYILSINSRNILRFDISPCAAISIVPRFNVEGNCCATGSWLRHDPLTGKGRGGVRREDDGSHQQADLSVYVQSLAGHI